MSHEVSEGPADADRRKLVRVTYQNEALYMSKVQREKHRNEIIHSQHRALVDDDGLFLPVLLVPP